MSGEIRGNIKNDRKKPQEFIIESPDKTRLSSTNYSIYSQQNFLELPTNAANLQKSRESFRRNLLSSKIAGQIHYSDQEHLSDSRDNIILGNEEEDDIKCSAHGEKLIMYCKSCSKILCLQCITEHHLDQKFHEYIKINLLKDIIISKAENIIESLEEKINNLEPEFDLESLQKKGLQTIYESKSRMMSCIEDYYNELIEQYKALTYKHSIVKQKEVIREKAKQLIGELELFTNKNMNANLMVKFCTKDYTQNNAELEKSIEAFINKTKKEYRLPRLLINEHQLDFLNDILLNYIHIKMQPENKSEDSSIAIKVESPSYFIGERKLLHALLPLEKQVYLYDVNTLEHFLLSVKTLDSLPRYMQSVMTPNMNLYLFGGIDKQGIFSRNTFLFQPDGKLVRRANMLIGKIAQGVCYAKGIIYSLGGKLDLTNRTEICEKYIIKDDKWEPLPSMSCERASPGVCCFSEEDIYVFFGVSKENELNNNIEKFNIKQMTWTIINVINILPGYAVMQMSCHQLNEEQILILGGLKRNMDTEAFRSSSRACIFRTTDNTLENFGSILPYNFSSDVCAPFVDNGAIWGLKYVNDRTYPDLSEFSHIFGVMKIDERNGITMVNIVNAIGDKKKKKMALDSEKLD